MTALIINDTLGHSAGDALLRVVAQRVSDCVSGSASMVFRLGGNEFAILQEGKQPADALVLAPLVMKAICVPALLGEQAVEVMVTAGVALAADLEAASAEALLQCADLAMQGLLFRLRLACMKAHLAVQALTLAEIKGAAAPASTQKLFGPFSRKRTAC